MSKQPEGSILLRTNLNGGANTNNTCHLMISLIIFFVSFALTAGMEVSLYFLMHSIMPSVHPDQSLNKNQLALGCLYGIAVLFGCFLGINNLFLHKLHKRHDFRNKKEILAHENDLRRLSNLESNLQSENLKGVNSMPELNSEYTHVLQSQETGHGSGDEPQEGARHKQQQPRNVSRWSIILLVAVVLLVSLLVAIGIKLLPQPPEWLNHLIISLVVVAIVHLLDRYVFAYETRKELDELGEQIVHKVTAQTGNALHASTKRLLTEHQSALDETKIEISKHIVTTVGDNIKDLVQTTTTSLDTLRTGIEADIERQTSALVKISASLEAMGHSGISRIYADRDEAAPDMKAALLDSETTIIRIIGISLNDIVEGLNKHLAEAWQTLVKFIEGTEAIPHPEKGLNIRILIIDPNCIGAQLRSNGEARAQISNKGRLYKDVTHAIGILHELQTKLKQNTVPTTVTFECHVYRLPPILFLCLVDHACFVQQYHFWSDRLKNTPVPMVEYLSTERAPGMYPMHSQMQQHFDWIWEKASIPVERYVLAHEVGVDEGVTGCGLVNVFMDKAIAAKRMEYLIKSAESHIFVQGVSLKSLFGTGDLSTAMKTKVFDGNVPIRVLILNPNSEQAKYRAYRERLLQQDDSDETFQEYMLSDQHSTSDLLNDTDRTLKTIRLWKAERTRKAAPWTCKLGVRLYDSAPSSFMLCVDDTVLVEQYNYGKIIPEVNDAPAANLGTDMPLLEFQCLPSDLYKTNGLRSPFGLQVDHFRFAYQTGKPEATTQNVACEEEWDDATVQPLYDALFRLEEAE